jgi:hypothetical protein
MREGGTLIVAVFFFALVELLRLRFDNVEL